MGSLSSSLNPENSQSSSDSEIHPESPQSNFIVSESETYFMDGFGDADFSKLDDLLIDILSFVSTYDLIFNCRFVCRKWKDIIEGHSVWKIKCQRKNKFIPAINFDRIPEHFYEKIFIFNPYGRNLLNNPCGQDGLNHWQLIRNPGDGFRVENPPQGADPVPSEVGVQHCFATTFLDCTKYQLIDLLSVGISEEILGMKTTKIEIGEWYAARFDCASEYRLNVSLLDKGYREQDTEITVKLHTIDDFEFYYREEQWVGKEWHKITHTFENVGEARYVFFQHSGRDKQFWAGHYGSKMTGAYVKIIV